MQWFVLFPEQAWVPALVLVPEFQEPEFLVLVVLALAIVAAVFLGLEFVVELVVPGLVARRVVFAAVVVLLAVVAVFVVVAACLGKPRRHSGKMAAALDNNPGEFGCKHFAVPALGLGALMGPAAFVGLVAGH